MSEQLTKYIRDRVSITDNDLQTVLSHFHTAKVKKNEYVGRIDDPARRMYFVVKGCLRIYFLKPDGTEVIRRFAFENTFTTSLVSFITGEALKDSTQATEDCELLYISRGDFYSLVDKIPSWDKFYRRYLEYAYVNNTNRMQSFVTLDATERYRLLLNENPEIVLRLPNKYVANYLNITQEALSRIKHKV
jgi:CRP-like cAMP-binding protein